MMKVVIYVQISTDRGEQNIRQQVAYVENLFEKIRISVERAKKEGKYKGGKKGRTWRRKK